jgi:hypothetical protein
VRFEQFLARCAANVPIATQQRLAEVLLEHPDHDAVLVEYLVAPAKLEHRLRLDHEEVAVVVRRDAEADVLLDPQLLLLHIEEWAPLLGRPRSGDTDPVLVRDGLEDLLDQ